MRRLSYLVLFLIVNLLFALSSCSGGVVDVQKARALADRFMEDVTADRRGEIYAKMETEFYALKSKDEFVSDLDGLYEQVGKPIRFEFASNGGGVRVITAGPYNGQTKQTCDITYNVTTTKGIYPAMVRVVNSEGGVAVTYFKFAMPN